MDDILIAREELGRERLRPAEHQVGRLSADHQALELPHLQLEDAVYRPWQRVVDSRQNARFHYGPEAGDYRLLICLHEKNPRQDPEEQCAPCHGPQAWRSPDLLLHRDFEALGFPWRARGLCWQGGAHRAPASPRVNTFSSSESELRMAVVLSSSTFL